MKLRFAAVLTGLFMAQSVMADAEAEAKYRHDVMEAIGGHMGAMVVILKNQIHTNDLVLHANGLAALADIAPEVFPEGSLTEKSKALPDVWENPEDFDVAMTRFVEAAEGMANAAADGEMAAIGAAMKELGGSCKGCHDDYKKE